ncbi:MAG: tRNA lysidine(34) synthetase TilS [Flavobacteriales bacterium]|nr:tRNA lysidine(34) synthetase TilS [Flavobacteriales bacterium]
MNKITHHLKSFFNSHPADLYFVAVSGGVDSMLLLDLMAEEKLPIQVLHVNYHLRGEESEQDELLVRNYCESNKIPITIESIYLKENLEINGGNLQNEARKVRYDFFKQELNKVSNSKLVLAHHLNDQLETFFLQLLRNSGLAGLSGMSQAKNKLLRPLLNFKKEEIYSVAIERKINWREDKSNSKNDYSRNRLRNEIIPMLSSEIPSLENSILLLQEKFQENLVETLHKIDAIHLEIEKSMSLNIETWNQLQAIEKIELLKKLSIPTFLFDAFNQLTHAQKGAKIQWNANQNIVIREDNHFQFITSKQEFKLPKISIEKTTSLPSTFSKSTIYLDESKIIGEISIRKWQIGDRIYPIGLKGSKLISDVITDAKIPNHLRENQLVLIDEEKILACVNLLIDRRAIASKSSELILKVDLNFE